MDQIDRKILAMFQHDTRLIADVIGAAVGLSAAAVQRRIKRMRADGVIAAEIAVLDPRATGVLVTCIVLLTLASRPRLTTHLDRFKRKMRELPEVQQCYHVTGSSDIVLVISAASMDGYADFVRRAFEANDDIMRYETLVVIDRVKLGLSIPLAEPPRAAKARRR